MAWFRTNGNGIDGPGLSAVGQTFTGTAGDDTRDGTARDDSFHFGQGGNDTLSGRDGNDTFFLGAAFAVGDHADGGKGNDTLVLHGDYFPEFTDFHITADMMHSIEVLRLRPGFDYRLVPEDGSVGRGAVLTVDASQLQSDDRLLFGANLEQGSFFHLTGGAGGDLLGGAGKDDELSGGGGDDNLSGSLGGDTETGGAGADMFTINSANESTGLRHDIVTDFNTGDDVFNILPVITGIDHAVGTGALSTASFDADLEAAIGNHELRSQHAVVFKPDSGDLAGHTFLIIEANGHAGYQAKHDFVVDITGAAHLGQLSTANFISEIG